MTAAERKQAGPGVASGAGLPLRRHPEGGHLPGDSLPSGPAALSQAPAEGSLRRGPGAAGGPLGGDPGAVPRPEHYASGGI